MHIIMISTSIQDDSVFSCMRTLLCAYRGHHIENSFAGSVILNIIVMMIMFVFTDGNTVQAYNKSMWNRLT